MHNNEYLDKNRKEIAEHISTHEPGMPSPFSNAELLVNRMYEECLLNGVDELVLTTMNEFGMTDLCKEMLKVLEGAGIDSFILCNEYPRLMTDIHSLYDAGYVLETPCIITGSGNSECIGKKGLKFRKA